MGGKRREGSAAKLEIQRAGGLRPLLAMVRWRRSAGRQLVRRETTRTAGAVPLV